MIDRVFTHSTGIQSICPTSTGLWIAHQGGLSFLDPESGRQAKWTTADGIPAHPVLHVAQEGSRIAVATPNGLAWSDDAARLLQDTFAGAPRPRWQRALAHARGTGAYLNGIAFVHGRLHATTGGGRIYREGAGGFELLELPLPQARLLHLLALECQPERLRLLVISNNCGILLLATGAAEEPSLYQWSEQEGLTSRYATTVIQAGEYVVVGVHGCAHVARRRDLLQRPAELRRWGRIQFGDPQGPVEHGRVHAVCAHGEHLYLGTATGLYRLPLSDLEAAASGEVEAEPLDEVPVRHLASHRGELWCVQHSSLCRLVEGAGAATPREVLPDGGASGRGALRFRRRPEAAAFAPRITTFSRRWRNLPESRWRASAAEPESARIACLAATPRGLACGGDGGRVLHFADEHWSCESVVRQQRSPEVHALAHDPEAGTLWCATRHGLFGRDFRGRWLRDLEFPGRAVHQLVSWQGMLLALGSAGLHVRVQGAWSEVAFRGENPSFFLAGAGAPGLVLAARPGASYYLWSPAAPRPERWDLAVGRANCLAWDGLERLWIGTDHGLVRWQGNRLESYAWEGEAENHITAVLVHAGNLHVGSHAGAWVAASASLDPARGTALESRGKRLGLLDGLPHAHVTSMLVHDGRVWVGTQGGLAALA
ncbi:MAG TPA: two-component regulator propeller domain-containing protein [Candidatus Krumholzibacteria bacterium]|nr:two-component regulator propeller domain-containing protein [Candidatus Krumholzibacteria bacterium]